jgi:hypothetical protein
MIVINQDMSTLNKHSYWWIDPANASMQRSRRSSFHRETKSMPQLAQLEAQALVSIGQE